MGGRGRERQREHIKIKNNTHTLDTPLDDGEGAEALGEALGEVPKISSRLEPLKRSLRLLIFPRFFFLFSSPLLFVFFHSLFYLHCVSFERVTVRMIGAGELLFSLYYHEVVVASGKVGERE